MKSTERKLDEARYFFTLLNIDDPYFDYMLSAFLNAARSIGWVMRHEYNKVEGWEKWFNEYYLSDKAKQLLKEINELRIESTKRAGLKTDFFFLQTDLIIDDEFNSELQKFRELEDGEYNLSVESISEEIPKNSDSESIRFIGKIDRAEKPYINAREKLKTSCEEYLILMKEVVITCVNKFPLLKAT